MPPAPSSRAMSYRPARSAVRREGASLTSDDSLGVPGVVGAEGLLGTRTSYGGEARRNQGLSALGSSSGSDATVPRRRHRAVVLSADALRHRAGHDARRPLRDRTRA